MRQRLDDRRQPLFDDSVALIGIGLIGSSLAWRAQARRPGTAHRRRARTAGTRDKAMRWASSTACTTDPPPRRRRGADLVVLCTPLGAYAAIAEAMAPALKRGRHRHRRGLGEAGA